MISSMTAAAFAAARVADGTTEWLDTENSGDLGSSGEDEGATDSADEKPRGFFSRIQQFFERLTTTAEKIDFDNDNTNPFVDQESKERVAYMIDSVIAQASIILRNVNIRVECELGLPGLNRASGVALSFAYLSVTNQQSKSTDGCAKADPENARSYSVPGCKDSRSYGDGWSWLWRWGSARKTDSSAPPTGSDDVINPPGSLSTMLHKNVHLEGVEVFWDLWDTRKQQDCQDSLSSVETSNVGGRERRNSLRGVSDDLSSPGRVPKVAIVYPTEENMVASAKLLTLTGVHTARVSVRCPLFSLNQTRPTEAQGDINSPEPQPSNPWSLFELRIHLDLGAIVACVCPSQFYWLQLLVGRLSHIWNKYTEQVTSERTVQQFPAPNPRSPAESSSFFPNSTGPVESRQLSGLSRPRGYPESTHYTLPHGFSEAELVDLDLNHDIPSPSTMTSPLVDSKLFWSCLTETDEMTSSRGMETTGFPAAGSEVYNSSENAGHTGRRTETSEPRFSVTANVLCVALVAFYEDESASSMSKIPLSKQSEMCTSVGPASRRSHISQRLSSYGSYYPNKPSATKESLDDATDTGLTRSFSSQYDVSVEQLESQCEENKENTTPSESTLFSNVQNMATLPGPFIFFSRFAGLMPWRQTVQSQRTGSPFPHRSTASQSNCSSSTIEGTAPMRIDRNDVDTGTLTPAAWVSQLRSQFAELASPRDHICFVGGLWHMEVCSRSVTADEMTGVQKPFFSNELLRQSNTVESSFTTCTQLDFGAHLFGIELSECLFPDEPCSDLNIPDPVMVRLLVFPDRARSTGDRSVRGPSESAAVKCNGLFHLGLTVPSNSGGVQPIRNAPTSTPVDTLHLDSAVCHIDVDISLSDRIHRITDAVAAASEAVAKFLPVGLDTSTAKVPRWQEDLHHDVDHYGTVFGLSTKNTTQTDCSQFRQHHKTAPSVGLNSANAETQYDASNHRLQLDVKCAGFEFFLRFPIPLEAIRLPPSQKMSDLRKTLWNSGTPLWFSRADLASDSPNIATTNDPTTSPNSVGLAWWRRTLRREYLRIVLSKLNLGYRTPLAEGGHGQANRGAPLQTPTTAKVNPSRGASDKQPTVGLIESANEPEIRISLRSMSVYLITPHQEIQANPLLQLSGSKGTSDFIGVSIHFSPLGRQELVERPNDKAEFAAYGGEPHVYTYAHERFEMGVDLASNPTNPQPQVHNPTSTASDQSIAWSLWKRTGPQNNPNVPFVIRRYFLQDAPKAHSKQCLFYDNWVCVSNKSADVLCSVLTQFQRDYTLSTCLIKAGPHSSSSADGSSTLGDGSSPTWWPGLVPFSWQSVGYPPPRPASSGVDPTPAPTSGPMLTLAVEHKQLKRIHASSGCPMYRDDLNCTLRLQNACLVHWPHIDSANPTTDSALPGWLARLIDVLGTPSAQAISVLLPGYKQPDTLLVQHIHLECVALTWATPEDCQVFGLPSGPIPPTDIPLKSIRAFVACETINFTVNAASEPESFNLLSPAPGMLIMAFLSNITMFLCPIYRKPPSTLQLNQPESVPSQFLRWLNVLKLSDCVCVAELDHLELRCFCSPMRVTQMVNSESVTSYLTRVDVRVTDNRCCLHTCADSIVALQRLIEVLAVSGASPQSRPMVSEVVSDTHNPQSVRSAMNSPSRFRVPVPAQSRSNAILIMNHETFFGVILIFRKLMACWRDIIPTPNACAAC
ncbi:hypothetical protein CSKR_113412 [Clonorchis sinensis]|uniref:Uncharacterized protein n=1 Tax=Clonorchis sinensis TaxID=79923 RepID=A0A8T1ME09_CLOSI|nr:hypothetical protein CSKR_113412 [Clonorchis sinensis]